MEQDEKTCPFCGETIKQVAIKCKHCESVLVDKNVGNKSLELGESKSSSPNKANKNSSIAIAIAIAVLSLIFILSEQNHDTKITLQEKTYDIYSCDLNVTEQEIANDASACSAKCTSRPEVKDIISITENSLRRRTIVNGTQQGNEEVMSCLAKSSKAWSCEQSNDSPGFLIFQKFKPNSIGITYTAEDEKRNLLTLACLVAQ